MGNSDLQKFPNESSQSKNLPSPKLISGNMNQTKTATGSPKSPKSDGSPKSDSASSLSPSKSGHLPSSTKSSPGNAKNLSLKDRLALSKGKKLPGSKSPPTSPNTLTSSKTDLSKESSDLILKSDEGEKSNLTNQVCNDFLEIKVENNQLPSEQHLVKEESEQSVSNEIKQNVNIESGQIEVTENQVVKCDINDTIVVEDLVDSNKPLRIDDSVILEQKSKKDIRQKVWEFMEEKSLVVFPKPCFNRIPNFKGCINASQLLEKLEEFKKAKTVQVTPDKAQETARFITLSWGKRLLVPLLRLKEGLLQIVSLPFAEPSAKILRSASTQKGLRKYGNKLITLDHNSDGHHIDMIILGSVAVDKKGRRIGIGNGLCDLEFAILSNMNMVTDKTVVVTIVHDAQVFDTLSTDLFKPYDVPVDIIITQTEIIKVENRLDRPKDVFWNYISKRRLLEMPPLQLLRTKQEKMGDIVCTLKDVDSEPEEIPQTPKTFKKYRGYRRRRSHSTRSETNDSVFKDTEVPKRRSKSKQSLGAVSKNSDSKIKSKRDKSSSNQQHRSNSTDRHNNQKGGRSSSKKPVKRRTKSESAKTVALPSTVSDSKNSNSAHATSPSIDTPKNKRRSRQKLRQRVHSEDIDKQSVHQFNAKFNGNNKHRSRSNSRVTRRDYIDHQDFGREVSIARSSRREYIQSSKKYYSQSRRPSYSQERQSHSILRSNSGVRHDLNRATGMQQNRFANGPSVRQNRYYNGPIVRHNSYNSSVPRQNVMNNHVIRHNSFSNDHFSRQNNYYDGIITRHNSYSKGSTTRQDGYTNSRVFRPPHHRNGNGMMSSQTNERDYVRESRPHFIDNHSGYLNSNDKPNYSRFNNGDEFVLKVGNIANNVRVRDLKAALMDRGVKPLHITWRGPRGFAYLRYNNATDMNKDNIMGSLQNVRIKPNGVETAQTQTLIVTECQFS